MLILLGTPLTGAFISPCRRSHIYNSVLGVEYSILFLLIKDKLPNYLQISTQQLEN